MAYEVPDLPYDYNALEPHIDEQTMRIHHDKHHQAYVDKANAALEGTEWADRPVEDVLAHLDQLPEAKRGPVRNNAGGHANHSLFWTVLKGGGGAPSGDLAGAIDAAFGGLDALKQQMSDAGVNRFGSGWSWLVVNGSGELEVMSTANQDSPISEGKTPIFGIDVWEHAYYLKYQNRRPDYLAAIWNVVNWDEVAERYAAARSAAAAV
ncbi:MAG TPA: superoxide dismutase [Thermoleophilia bacterium]|nr:superoxide dismutase [Thermoleophilia bacterium]